MRYFENENKLDTLGDHLLHKFIVRNGYISRLSGIFVMLILTETNEPDEQEMMNYKTAVVVCTGIYIQDLQTEK